MLKITQMKNLIISSFLIVSLTVSAQFIENRSMNFGNMLSMDLSAISNNVSKNILNTIFEIEVEEEDEPFDFDIKKYLPYGFNPYKNIANIYNKLYDYITEEADEPFEFNTKDYLPANFDPYIDISMMDEYESLNEEADEPFDFDTKEYLPKNFNPYN